MKNKFRIVLTVVLCLILTLSFTACNKNKPTTTAKQEVVDLTGVNGDGATVNTSVLYNGNTTLMRYDNTLGAEYNCIVTDEYKTGNQLFKPAWNELQKRLKFTIKDITPINMSSISQANTTLAAQNYKGVNVMNIPASAIEDVREKNIFVDLNNYREYLPNFFKFVDAEENKIVKASITSEDGGIYYAPYFDGMDDVETMLICRVDWVEKLLDDDVEKYGKDDGTGKKKIVYDEGRQLTNTGTAAKPSYSGETFYNGYYDSMNTTFTAMKNATETQEIHIEYSSGEGVIAIQNALSRKDGKNLTEALKKYIDKFYVTPGYISKRSELFCGQNACYNADELVALWRCVYTNPELLSGNKDKDIIPFFPRGNTADRTYQVLQLAQLWGVRGYDSRNGYFYFDEEGKLQDARSSADMMEALTFLHQLYKEGLIAHDYTTAISESTAEYRETMYKENQGFMTYDYNQTTTIYNETVKDSQSAYRNISPILYPYADWDNKATKVSTGSDGEGVYAMNTNDLYMYTESWRSVKTEGWAITYDTALNNKPAFKKALEMFDYLYTTEGQYLMTYGPDAWMEHNLDGSIKMMTYNGREVPVISEKALTELKDMNKGNGNYTNYYRYYVGATLPIGFIKEQGMEYQTVDAKGKIGLEYINNAKVANVLQHPSMTTNVANKQNVLVPTTFALSKNQQKNIQTNSLNLVKSFNNSSAKGENIFHSYVLSGKFQTSDGQTYNKEQMVTLLNDTWSLKSYVRIHQTAYDKMYK